MFSRPPNWPYLKYYPCTLFLYPTQLVIIISVTTWIYIICSVIYHYPVEYKYQGSLLFFSCRLQSRTMHRNNDNDVYMCMSVVCVNVWLYQCKNICEHIWWCEYITMCVRMWVCVWECLSFSVWDLWRCMSQNVWVCVLENGDI